MGGGPEPRKLVFCKLFCTRPFGRSGVPVEGLKLREIRPPHEGLHPYWVRGFMLFKGCRLVLLGVRVYGLGCGCTPGFWDPLQGF